MEKKRRNRKEGGRHERKWVNGIREGENKREREWIGEKMKIEKEWMKSEKENR